MNMEVVDNASLMQNTARIIPPEVKFTASPATFSGTAKPGLTIKLASGIDGQAITVTVGSDGKWKIPLGEQPHWYTVFRLWASDCDTGAESARVQFTFGGNNPTLEDVYVGATTAFGFAPQGSEVAIYASSGKLISLGQTSAGNFWHARFVPANSPKPGDTVCLIAKLPSGNTSMPYFTKAHAFSVERAGVSKAEGSGARPGDIVQLFDHESGELIEGTTASDDGDWSITLANALPSDSLIRFQRIHKNGAVSDGPVAVNASSDCLAPAVNGINSGFIWGAGLPNASLSLSVYNSMGAYQHGYSGVPADADGQWKLTLPSPAVQGYFYKVTASYNGSTSSFYGCVQYKYERSTPPMVDQISNHAFAGWADIGHAVVISTEALGVVYRLNADDTGHFQTPNLSTLGVSDGDLVFFTTLGSTNQQATHASTSSYETRKASSSYIQPDIPIMTTYEPTLFAGTESDTQSTITVHDRTNDDSTVNFPAVPVQSDTKWSTDQTGITIIEPSEIGNQVYAIATDKSSGDLGPTRKSKDYTVGVQSGGTHVPIPPEIENPSSGTLITGQTMINTYVTVSYTYTDYNQSPPQPAEVDLGTVGATGTDWAIKSGPVPNGGVVKATAQFVDKSEMSDPYYRKIGVTNIGSPALTSVGTTYCKGKAAVQGQRILAWRISDGTKMVDYQCADNQVFFTAQYVNGLTLETGDLLNLVSSYTPDNGSMTPFVRREEGYGV
nr:hypothetical protein [Marinicella sp. W31]MDC2879879.1 hypothetical protein [Marinicella sp. W31]